MPWRRCPTWSPASRFSPTMKSPLTGTCRIPGSAWSGSGSSPPSSSRRRTTAPARPRSSPCAPIIRCVSWSGASAPTARRPAAPTWPLWLKAEAHRLVLDARLEKARADFLEVEVLVEADCRGLGVEHDLCVAALAGLLDKQGEHGAADALAAPRTAHGEAADVAIGQQAPGPHRLAGGGFRDDVQAQ